MNNSQKCLKLEIVQQHFWEQTFRFKEKLRFAMATFESLGSLKSLTDEDMMVKQPIKRLEHAIRMFTKVAIPTDLERLSQHRSNIEKYQRLQQWSKLNAELVNASRTVQQLKANVREMEKTRNQIRDEDLDEFDDRLQTVKEEAIAAIIGFIDLHGNDDSPFSQTENMGKKNVLENEDKENDGETDNNQMQMSLELHDLQQIQEQVQMHMEETAAKESWDHLKDNLVELNTMIHDFSAMVHHQQDTVDSIVDHVEDAQVNVEHGVVELSKASKMKAMMFPVAGAVLGGVVAGPVGLLAGAKLGLAAAVGGGVIGFTGGKIFKNRQDRANDIELQNLSSNQKKWSSAPDLSTEDLLRDTDD